jgi:hypothetical protein
MVAIVVSAVALLSSCSTFKGSSDGTWRASYFMGPDRVWGAIEISLIALDYEIVSKNRPDGVIRGTSEPADDGTVIELVIDQVMRTDDQVDVYVKPSFADGKGSNDPDLLKAAADAFMKAVNDTLYG